MRALALVLVLPAFLAAGLAFGAPAKAATSRPGAEAEAPVAKRPALRGPQAARAAAPRVVKPAPIPVAFAPRLTSPIPVDRGQCRLDCAQAYYFCLAGSGPDSCPQTWTNCLADCERDAAKP